MKASDVIRAMLDPSPYFICINTCDEEDEATAKRYRVPLGHCVLAHASLRHADLDAGAQAFNALPAFPGIEQLRAVLPDNHGIGLWASRAQINDLLAAGSPEAEPQPPAGSLLIFPPAEWRTLRDDFARWQFPDVDACFAGLPYTFDDIVLFAGLNFSPDRWFIVVRGPMAGRVFWWTHDGCSSMAEPWAADIREWADRVARDLPESLGGLSIFFAADSLDPVDENAQLYPLEYRRETPERA